MPIMRRRLALRVCRSALVLCCLQSPAPVSAAAPCTAELASGGDVQAAVDGLRAGPATLCLGSGEFPVHRFVSIDRDAVRRPHTPLACIADDLEAA